jgi:2-isopropylmalate synthase
VFVGRIAVDGETRSISGRGNGLISGVIDALAGTTGPSLDVVDYSEHAIGHGADAQAAAYVECRTPDGRTVFGVGIDADIATASVRAVLSAANRA